MNGPLGRDAEEPLHDDGATPATGALRDARPATLEGGVGTFWRAQLIVLLANAFLAAFFSVVQRKPFLRCLLYTQVIGNLMFWLNWGLHRLQRQTTITWKTSAAAILLGGVLGVPAVRLCEVRALDRRLLDAEALLPAFVAALVSGMSVAYWFLARARAWEGQARLRQEMLQRAEHERQVTQTELKLLQAQIEPHFLFNTLSNVLQLVDADPRAAKRMLLNLTSYLRASLHRTRAGATTLGEELDLVRAYLEIQAERMGARLAWRIECPPELRGLPLPPLLLQPLVENAVRHGLEPRPGGGEVLVRAERGLETLSLEVRDTGVGIGDASGSGVGLANVRARVRAVSRGQGSMVIQPREPHGLCVRIALPLGGAAGADPVAAGGAP